MRIPWVNELIKSMCGFAVLLNDFLMLVMFIFCSIDSDYMFLFGHLNHLWQKECQVCRNNVLFHTPLVVKVQATKEGNVLFNDALNTLYLRLYGVGHMVKEGRKDMFYLQTHSTHFIYSYMASDIWLRTILIVRKETRCRHIGYSYRLTARFLLYAPSHRQDNTYHGLCYTSRGALVGTRNSWMGPPHEGSIRRPIAPRANALPLSYVPLLATKEGNGFFNDALNTLYLRLYGVEHIAKDHSDSQRGNPLPPHRSSSSN